MKKFTLCLSLLMAGAAAASAVAPNALPEVSTSRDDAKLYVISSYRGHYPGGTSPALLAGSEVESVVTTAQEVSDNAKWYFLAGEEEGSYYICNYGLWDEDWAEDQPALGKGFKVALSTEDAEACVWYLLPNGVNELGLAISSSDPWEATSCVDKFNAGVGVSGGWHPSETDWQGTTWSFIPVDENKSAEEMWTEIENAWNELHAGPIKTEALANIASLATSNPWTAALYESTKAQINAVENPTQAAMTEITQAAINEAATIINENIVGKLITLQGVRPTVQGHENTYLCSETFDGDSIGFALIAEKLGRSYWNAVAAEGGFKLRNNVSNLFIQVPNENSVPVNLVEEADDASVFTAGYFIGSQGGQPMSGVTIYTTYPGEGEDAAPVLKALNINSAGTSAVVWIPNDAGSTFNIAVGDANGIEMVGAEMINANAPVEFFNIQGIRVNPETAGPGLYIRRQGNKAVKVLVR